MTDDVVRRHHSTRSTPAPAKLLADAIREVERLREENARLREQNSELVLRGFALLSLLPPETTCGEVQKAKAALSATAIREGGKDEN